MKVIKEILTKSLLLVAGCIMALLLVEAGVRALGLYRFPEDDFVETDPELGWSHVPNKGGYYAIEGQKVPVKINSKGLRDREYAYKKEEGTFRILVLGDSFTEAFQVPLDDTFCKVLEAKLNDGQRNYEVINAGFAGVGTDYQLLFFRQEGHKYHPDLVLVAFFLNDAFENYRSKSVLDDATAPGAYEEKGFIVKLKQFLAKNSCAYNYFGYILPAHMPTLAKLLMRIGLLSPLPIDTSEGANQYLVFSREYGHEWQMAWDVTRTLILELDTEVKEYGSKLVIVSIPFREQADKALWNKILRAGDGEREWDANKPDRILSEFLRDRGIPFLPLLSHFREMGRASELYYPSDGHWNRRGHTLAANIIYEWLIEKELVPIETRSSRVAANSP